MDWTENKIERRNLIDQDINVRKRTLNYLKSCLELGIDLEANLILAVPSGVWNMLDSWTPEHVELCINAMQELGDHARSLGKIYFVIEPLNRYENQFLRRCDQALELLKKANHPQVKMMLDCFHMNIEEDNNGDAIRWAGNDLIHCHLADFNRKSSGRGQSDWFEIFRALRDIDFHGSLVCETILPTGNGVLANLNETRPEADLYAKECIEYLKFIENIV